MPFDQELIALGIGVPSEEDVTVLTQDDIVSHVDGMSDMLASLPESDFIFMLKKLIESYEGLE